MAVHAGIIRSLKNVVNVFMSPVVGALSDRWGRRPMMFYGRVGWLGEHDRLLASPLPAPMYMYRPLSPIPAPAAAHLPARCGFTPRRCVAGVWLALPWVNSLYQWGLMEVVFTGFLRAGDNASQQAALADYFGTRAQLNTQIQVKDAMWSRECSLCALLR